MSTKSFNGRTLGPAAFEAYMDFCDDLKNGKNDEAIDRVKYICAVCEGYIIPQKPLTEAEGTMSILNSIGSLDKKVSAIKKFIDEKGSDPLTSDVIKCFYEKASDGMGDDEMFAALCDCAGGCDASGTPNGAKMDGESLFNDSAFGEPEGMSELDFDGAGYSRDDQFEPEETEQEILDRAEKAASEGGFQNQWRGAGIRDNRVLGGDVAAEADKYLADAGYDTMTAGGVRPDNAKFFGDKFNVDF